MQGRDSVAAADPVPAGSGDAVTRYDLTSDAAEVWDEAGPRIARIARDGDLVLGDDVARFEAAFASFQGVEHVVGVGCGTDALELALRAAGVAAHDEVILPTNTFIASATAIARIGARPVPVDCDDQHLLIDVEAAAAAVGPRTRALLPVHLYGQMAPMGGLLDVASRHDLVVIEDCAQVHGATQDDRPAGGFGTAGGTSFHPHKNLAAWGDAGAVLTDDADIAERVRRLRQYGADPARVHVDVGWNSRLDTVQAAVLLARLGRLAAGNDRRERAARYYTERIGELELPVRMPTVAPANRSTWHLYVVRVPARDAIAEAMGRDGIGVSVDYATPVHLQPAFATLGQLRGACPVAERAAGEILSLPIYPAITRAQQDRVVDSLAAALHSARWR